MNDVACFLAGGASETTINRGPPRQTLLVEAFPFAHELTPVLELGSSLHLAGSTLRIHNSEGRTWASAALPSSRDPQADPPLGDTRAHLLPPVYIHLAEPGCVVASLALADGRDVVVGTLAVRRRPPG